MTPSLRRLLTRLAEGLLVCCAVLPYVAVLLIAAHRPDGFGLGFDFHVFWQAAQAVAHGHSPYDPAGIAHASQVARSDMGAPVPNDHWAVYPPALYLVLIPLGLLPWAVAGALGMSALALTPALALRVMGVRDWRCYCLMYASAPILTSIFLGAISSVLMLGVALVWRGRHACAAAIATIVAKLFLWPLAFVVAALDGARRGVLVVAGAAALAVGSWAVIGFADIERYPSLLSDLSAAEAHNSLSTTGLAYTLGLAPAVGTYAGVLLGLLVAAAAVRRGLRGDRDAACTLALAAALLASPIVWTHYLVLLFLPLAARFPRFHPLWLAPLALWAFMKQAPDGELWAFSGAWICFAGVVLVTLRSGREGRATVARRTRTRPQPISSRSTW